MTEVTKVKDRILQAMGAFLFDDRISLLGYTGVQCYEYWTKQKPVTIGFHAKNDIIRVFLAEYAIADLGDPTDEVLDSIVVFEITHDAVVVSSTMHGRVLATQYEGFVRYAFEQIERTIPTLRTKLHTSMLRSLLL